MTGELIYLLLSKHHLIYDWIHWIVRLLPSRCNKVLKEKHTFKMYSIYSTNSVLLCKWKVPRENCIINNSPKTIRILEHFVYEKIVAVSVVAYKDTALSKTNFEMLINSSGVKKIRDTTYINQWKTKILLLCVWIMRAN